MVEEIYFISGDVCPKCKPMKEVAIKVSNETNIPLREIKIPFIDNPDFEIEMLESQICIMMTPAIIVRNDGKLVCIEESVGNILKDNELIEMIKNVEMNN